VSVYQNAFKQIDLKIVKKGEKIGIIKVPKSKRETVRKAGFFEDINTYHYFKSLERFFSSSVQKTKIVF